MINANIAYQTDEIARYFAENRVTWPQFYESERVVITQLNPGPGQEILDIGCGCGGLGLALRDQFGVNNYTGVEINPGAAQAARQMNPAARILQGDILDVGVQVLAGKQYDVVFSLSCVDWNVQFSDMLVAAWRYVRPGGYFVATFRLTAEEGCSDMTRSYQYINFDGSLEGECAAYVVLNAGSLMQQLAAFDPARINAFGYWGTPSATAITPYKQLCFAAFAIQKRFAQDSAPLQSQLTLPEEILTAIGQQAG